MRRRPIDSTPASASVADKTGAATTSRESSSASFYTVADQRFFVGAVLLINSLRITGHDGPITVLDSGLTPQQRRVLAEHAEVFSLPDGISANAKFAIAYPYFLKPRGTIVLLDSDIIVTGSLNYILEQARAGQLCVFSDYEADRTRRFPEWRQLFDLSAPPRPQPYVNSGFVALSTEHWPWFTGRWWAACSAIPLERTRNRGAPWESPLWDGDQDALNAILMAEVPELSVSEQPQVRATSAGRLRDTRVLDKDSLACSFGGQPTTLLHHVGTPKPWERQAWMIVQRDAYVELMPRLLLADDLALRLPRELLPLWAREGAFARLALSALTVMNGTVRKVVRGTSGPTRDRLLALRERLAKPT